MDNFTPDLTEVKRTTLNKQQKKRLIDGTNIVMKQDEAMWTALAGTVDDEKLLLVITTTEAEENMYPSVAPISNFHTPGPEAVNFEDDKEMSKLKETVDTQNPTLIYMHITFKSDEDKTSGYSKIMNFLDEEMSKGRSCLIADTRLSKRWEMREHVKCRGDLAVICNESLSKVSSCAPSNIITNNASNSKFSN